MPSIKSLSLIVALASLQAVSANPITPTKTTYPEIIPGPGLPSLAELNLTSAQLWEMPLPERPHHGLQTRNPKCFLDNPSALAIKRDLWGCVTYLINLPDQTACGVPARSVIQFASCGGAHAIGSNNGEGDISTWCSNVAHTLMDIVDSCTYENWVVGGSDLIHNAENMAVAGASVNWMWKAPSEGTPVPRA